MKTAVVALAPTGAAPRGIALWMARALQRPGHPCTLVWVSHDVAYQDAQPPLSDVETLYVNRMENSEAGPPLNSLRALAEQVAPILRRFDVVYSLAWAHLALATVRERRLSGGRSPFVVTVAGDSVDLSECGLSSDPAVWHQQSGERYQAQRSDCLICLGPVRPEDLRARGWVVPKRTRWLPLDRNVWWRLRQELESEARAIAAAPSLERGTSGSPALTVCIPHRNHGRLLPEAFSSLERQTIDDFDVVVVDDGSDCPESRASFDRMEARYSPRGWRFLRQQHRGPGAARNRAARHARSEYLAFLDSDDLALPRFVECMLEAAHYSGDDLLVPSARRAHAEGAEFVCRPPGPGLLEILLPEARGSTCLVRRSVFEVVGGFPEQLIAAGEGAAFLARVTMAGHAWDVIPEALYVSRETPGGFASSAEVVLSEDTVQRVYGERLNALRLPGLALALHSLQTSNRARADRVATLSRELDSRVRRTGGLRLLLMVSYWPYPPASGALQRWWAMIRYLGARHELTLLTFLAGGDARDEKPLLEHCRSVYAVRYGEPRPRRDPSLPFLVEERQSVLMNQALEALSRESYDAAVMQQIFLAPYREQIQAPVLLGEENVESSLLEQVAQAKVHGSLTPAFEHAGREAELMRQYEDQVWPQFPVRSAVSEQDRQEIQRRAGVGETILAENGADPALRLRQVRPDSDDLLFAGSLEWLPNVDGILYFLREIWPDLARRNGSLRFTLAGRNPVPELRALRDPRVELVASPEDMGRVAARASVSVVPLRIGSGTRLKILESMAWGLPVVSTSLGCSGLEVEDGKHLLIRDDPQAFAEAIEQVVSDRSLWGALREGGLSLIEHRYAWSRVLEPLDKKLWEMAATWKG